jgi:glycosyltransferase involved in cell wall biosynthesis
MTRVMVAVKTTEGALWILPQIDALRARGVDVVVLLPEGEGRLVTKVLALVGRDSGVELVRSPFNFHFVAGRRVVSQMFALRRVVRSADVDSVLYHLYATALAIRLATLGLRLSRVHMVAGPLYLESPLIATAERIFCRLDHHIICGSQYTLDLYRKLGMPRNRMSVVPYGVDTELFRPGSPLERAASRRKLGLPVRGLVAVMVSYVYAPKALVYRGQAIKGHEVLLRAWRDFHRRHPESTLVLVGSGFDAAGERHRQRVMQSSDYHAARDGVVWLDSVLDVRDAYRSADVSVSPSLSDNHGAALEASAMGVPCIVSDAGALPEAVERGVGWIHTAGSADDLLRCLEQVAAADSAGELGRRGAASSRYMIKHFDQRVSTQLVADQVCGRRKTAAAQHA